MRRSLTHLTLWTLAMLAVACRDTTSPGPTLSIAPGHALAAGDDFTCVLNARGQATCWGANQAGQLGRGDSSTSAGPGPVTGGVAFTQIAASVWTACGLAVDGAAWCWGQAGELGSGTAAASARPVKVNSDQRFTAITGGLAFCALASTGAVYCWGRDNNGELGNGTTSSMQALSPVAVAGLPSVVRLTSALGGTCGITASGAAYCWGMNNLGQLGIGSATASVTTPTPMAGALSFADVKLGAAASCGIAGGRTYCWGTNIFGALGSGSTDGTAYTYQPTPIDAMAPAFTSVYPGAGNNVYSPFCALTAAGAAYCWGADRVGQLGSAAATSSCSWGGLTTACSGTPEAVSGGYSFTVLATGAEHVCGITTTRQVVCWGSNSSGQLGGGSAATSSAAPVAVPGVQGP